MIFSAGKVARFYLTVNSKAGAALRECDAASLRLPEQSLIASILSDMDLEIAALEPKPASSSRA
jgi:hypothetical protein